MKFPCAPTKVQSTEVQQHSEAGLDTAPQMELSRREGSSLHTCWKHSSYCSPRCHWASLGQGIFPAQGQVLAAELLSSWAAPALPTGSSSPGAGLGSSLCRTLWGVWQPFLQPVKVPLACQIHFAVGCHLQIWWGALIMMLNRVRARINSWDTWLMSGLHTDFIHWPPVSEPRYSLVNLLYCLHIQPTPHQISMKTVSKALLKSR